MTEEVKAAWAKVVELAKLGESYHRDGIARATPDMQDEIRAIVESTLASSPPTELEVEREGARLALLGPAPYYKLQPLYAELLRFWCAARGIDFALAAVLAALHYERHTPDDYVSYGAWLTRRAKPALEWELYPVWPLLHAEYRAAPADARLRARKIAHQAQAKAPLALRAAVAFVAFDDDELWTEDDRRAVVAATDVHGPLPHFAVLAECRRTALALGEDLEAAAVAAALKERAFVALQIMYRERPYPPHGEPLAALGTPEAMSVLVDAVQGKEIGPVVAAGLRAAPRAAIDGLAPRIQRGARALHPFARALLVSLVAEHPAVARASSAPPAVIATLLAEAGVDVPEADASVLPPSLARPPWREPAPKKPAKKTKPAKTDAVAVPLATVPFTERIDWGAKPPPPRENWHSFDAPELIARIEENRHGDGTVFLSDFTWDGVLDAPTAVRLLSSIEPTRLYGNVDDLERMFAAYDLAVLEHVLAYVKRQPDRLPGLRSVDSPRVAPIAAHAFATSKKNRDAGQAWLDAHPRAAAVALLPELVQAQGKARAPAEVALRHLAATHRAVLDEIAQAFGAAASRALEELVGSPAGPTIPKRIPKLPAFARTDRLPRPLLADRSRALSRDALDVLLTWIAISPRDEPQPALAEIARALDARSLARFAFGLFVEWVVAGGPAKEAWAMRALGWLGDAEVARALVPISRAWAPGGLPQRAQALVDVLGDMENDAALLGIHRLTKVQSRALAAHADKTLARVAAARGLGKDELADRLVPDLGLAADGTKSFLVRGRTYVVRFDADLVPTLVADDGETLFELPKAKKDDDDETAAFAQEEWKELKKSAKRLAREQALRLEAAMSTQRRFAKEHFETFFARHPFVVHLGRRLVWGSYEGGALAFAFRVAEDGPYAGIDDREVTLADTASIGLVHPLELDDASRKAWAARLFDYAIIQPFPQLGRETYALEEGERASTTLARFASLTVPSGKILGLERSGWKREAAGQGGVVAIFEKRFGDVTARIGLNPGIYLGDPTMHPQQTIDGVVFGKTELLPLGQVPAIAFSEVVRDLSALGDG